MILVVDNYDSFTYNLVQLLAAAGVDYEVVRNDAGQQVALTRNGEILILDPKGRELEKYDVPAGANLLVAGQKVRVLSAEPGGSAR